MSYRPESIPALTPDQIAALLGRRAPRVEGEPRPAPPSPWTPAAAGDPAFERQSRRDTVLANELLDRLREVRDVVAAAPLALPAAEQARDALVRFERALLELLRHHGT